MVGEMNYSDLLSSYVVNSVKVPGTETLYVPLPVLSHIMFMLFVLSVSIILMNLLVAKGWSVTVSFPISQYFNFYLCRH